MILRHLVFIALLPLILAGCGSTSSIDSSNLSLYTGTGFTISIPKTWTIIPDKQLPHPAKGTIALALSSPEIASGFANNMVILREHLSEPISSKNYATTNYIMSTASYTEFTKLAEKTVTFADKDESTVYTFEARYNTTTPRQRFFQTAKVCGDTVYLLTIGIGLDVTDNAKYTNLLEGFACTTIATKK